jgi:hypothetical protein
MSRLLADGTNHRRDRSLPFIAFADLTSSLESCRAILAVEKVLGLF